MEEKVYLDEGGNQVDQTATDSHLDGDDYIDDDLELDGAYAILDNPYNDSKGLEANFDFHDINVEFDEVQGQYDMEL